MIVFIIAWRVLNVERGGQVDAVLNFPKQFGFGPAKLSDSSKVPTPFLRSQVRVHDHEVLSPPQFHGQCRQLRLVLIGAVKVPHPAYIPGREPSLLRVSAGQVFRCCNSSSFFDSAADKFSNSVV